MPVCPLTISKQIATAIDTINRPQLPHLTLSNTKHPSNHIFHTYIDTSLRLQTTTMSNDPQNAQAAQAAMAARHRAAPAIQPVALRPGHMSNTAINAVIGRLIIVKGVRQNMTYNIEYTYSNKPGLPCIVHSAPAQQAQDASASLLNWLTGLLQSEDWLGW